MIDKVLQLYMLPMSTLMLSHPLAHRQTKEVNLPHG